MKWNKLTSVSELEDWKKKSSEVPVLFFKHSTRCSISSAAKGRLERHWDDSNPKNPKPVYLDLISFREISNKIAVEFNVQHESPQILLIKDGACAFHSSHYDINYDDVLANC